MSDSDFLRVDMPDRNEANRGVRRVAEAAHRLNIAIEQAVAEGYTVELIRTSRVHDGAGNWGDQMVPVIRDRRPEAQPAPAEAQAKG